MNSGKHEKFNVKSGQSTLTARDTRPKHQAENIDVRITDLGPQISLIEIDWKTDRQPCVSLGNKDVRSEEEKLAWPVLALPPRCLRPKRGASVTGLAQGAPIMLVAVFGRDQDGVESTVRQIELQQQQTKNFLPLFLTDSPCHSVFRHAGYNFEYFPIGQYCDETQRDLFQQKFLKIWTRWKAETLVDLSVPGFLKARLDDIEQFCQPELQPENKFQPRRKPPSDRSAASIDVAALKAEYLTKELDQREDSFVLYRILGNDLPPRHKEGQTLENLRFMLDHEPQLENCEKRWVVNRMVNQSQEDAILEMLEKHNQPYLHIPFELEEYQKQGWDLESFPDLDFFLNGRFSDMNEYGQQRAESYARRHKNRYAINNNGARNAALRDGRGRAKWVLPWDGNCFLTKEAWAEIVEGVTTAPYMKYFLVPMARALDNADLLQDGYRPEATEEPQILFRTDASEEFDERYHYGRRPKVELFLRLGLAGGWNGWYDDCWDMARPKRVEDAGSCGRTGWVSRLFSGQEELEVAKSTSLRSRGVARSDAVNGLLDQLDQKAADVTYDPTNLTAYDELKIQALATASPGSPKAKVFGRLIQEADLALQRGPFSVVDKLSAPPSNDKHDYYNPAPYWWPNPNTPNGYPLIFKDGLRIPGTRLYDSESDNFDRTRLQRLFDDTTILALAWKATGQLSYATHAAQNVRHWFINEESKMNPHLLFSQSRSLDAKGGGGKSGLIEMKDLYFLLDAVRLLEQSKAFDAADKAALSEWLATYLEWLLTSDQGLAERKSHNNHGTCFDLQTASIAAYLGDRALLQSTFRTSRERLLTQFTKIGRQPFEMKRTQTAHYCCFNLQCWVNLANLAARCGDNLWQFEGQKGQGLAIAFNWLLPYLSKENWPFEQIEHFDRDRFLPLFFAARELCPSGQTDVGATPEQAKPLYFPHDGIMPFWMLGTSPLRQSGTQSARELAKTVAGAEAPVVDSIVPTSVHKGQNIDVPLVEKKMWSGFSQSAQIELEAIKCDPEASQCDLNRSARALARWYYTSGNYDHTLKNIEDMRLLDSVSERERKLVEAYCLHQIGQPSEAEVILQKLLGRFPNNPNLCLAMANLHGGLRGNCAPEDGENGVDWLNKIYSETKIAPLTTQENKERVGLSGLKILSTIRQEQDNIDGPLVSVIVTIGCSYTYLAHSLQSLLEQTWRNLEIIVVDTSGCDETKQDLCEKASGDGRVQIVSAPHLQWEYQARNLGLQHVSGVYVTTLCANEFAHPEKIARQVLEFDDPDCRVALACQALLTENMQFIAGWHPEFSLAPVQATSAMIRTDHLMELGGWDAVEQDPDAFLMERLKKSAEAEFVRTACSRAPLSFSVEVSENHTPKHLKFPYGRRRDEHQKQLRAILRHLEPNADQDLPEEVDSSALPALTELTRRESDFDAVYVGDFAEESAGLLVLISQFSQMQLEGLKIGVFNWPDYQSHWNNQIGADLANLIDDNVVTLISGGETATTRKLVLCNPYIVKHPIDGLPEFKVIETEVLCGTHLSEAEIFDGFRRVMPTADEIEAVFQAPCRWVAV